MKIGVYFILLVVLTLNLYSNSPYAHNNEYTDDTEEIDYGIAISKIEVLPEGKKGSSDFDKNVTSSEEIRFRFTISHWNPKANEQWVQFYDLYARTNISIQLNSSIYDLSPNLDIFTIGISAPMVTTESFPSGVTNITYPKHYSFYLDVLNFVGYGLPDGIYRFSHYRVCLTNSEEMHTCDDDKKIGYYGATLEANQNGTIIKYDTLPDDWGTIFSAENENLLNFFSFQILSFTLIILYAVRKHNSRHRLR